MSLILIIEMFNNVFEFQIKFKYFCANIVRRFTKLMIELKDISGAILLTTLPNEGCKRKFTLMKEDYITLSSPWRVLYSSNLVHTWSATSVCSRCVTCRSRYSTPITQATTMSCSLTPTTGNGKTKSLNIPPKCRAGSVLEAHRFT